MTLLWDIDIYVCILYCLCFWRKVFNYLHRFKIEKLCQSRAHALRFYTIIANVITTRVSEVIMFSPCVFVCLRLCLCLYHDVCPDDLTMKDWCHTNNILQVHCWGCLVVQVMFHALMTSSMTSPGHKVGQIFKRHISVNIWARAWIKSSKCRKCSWLSFWSIQLPL